MIHRLILPLALRSLLLALGIAGITSVFLAPVRMLRGEQAMSATLKDVSAGISWTGSSISSGVFDPAGCQSARTCDVFTLNVDVSDDYRMAHPNFALLVRVTWEDTANDFDLYIGRDGKTLEDSSQGQTNSEELRLNHPLNGVYQIYTHSAAAATSTLYQGRVRLITSAFNPSSRSARYRKDPDGKDGPELFHFAPELVLDREVAIQGTRTDIEIDPFGNAYIAADGSDIAVGEPQFELGKVYATERKALPQQWAAALGRNRLYLASLEDSRLIVRRSDDGGRTYKQETVVTRFPNASTTNGLGNLISDRNRTLFVVFTGTSQNEIYLAKCVEPCARFLIRRIFSAGMDVTLNHPYPTAALDRAGGLHVSFSDGENIYLISSADGGTTWKDPVAINNPADTETEAASSSWVFAGDSGRVGITWLGRQGQTFYGFTADAFAQEPIFEYVRIGDPQAHPNAPSGTVDPFGNASIVYGQTRFVRQTGGERLFFAPYMAAAGTLKTETGTKKVSLNVRPDFTGYLTYLDEQRRLSLRAAAFTSSKRDGKRLALSGKGRLQDGSQVTFAMVTSDPKANEKEFSISLSNGYFAAGTLEGPPDGVAWARR